MLMTRSTPVSRVDDSIVVITTIPFTITPLIDNDMEIAPWQADEFERMPGIQKLESVRLRADGIRKSEKTARTDRCTTVTPPPLVFESYFHLDALTLSDACGGEHLTVDVEAKHIAMF